MTTALVTTRKRANQKRMAFALALAMLTGFSPTLPQTAVACPYCKSAFKPGTYTGEAKRVGNGVAYSWVTLTESALEGLNETAPNNFQEMERDMFLLMLPKEAMKTVFDHISLDWNAKGHPPLGIYDKPHFDIHFYTINLAAREKITALGKDVALCSKAVPSGFTPAGYVYGAGTEAPMMGGHWINPTAPELNGQPFTATFIYGSYNGNVAFLEPMVTKAFLESKPNFDEAIPLPLSYAKSAYYPTRYTVRHDAVRHEYTIAMEGMTWRDAAPKADVKTPVVAKPAFKPAPSKALVEKVASKSSTRRK